MKIGKKQDGTGCNISETHPGIFQNSTTFCVILICPNGDYPEQVGGFRSVDGPVALADIEASYPWGEEEFQKKMMDRRQFRQAWYHILIQRLALMEEACICH